MPKSPFFEATGSAYGITAKVFHWAIVLLLMVQFPIGWLMPDIRQGETPGAAMGIHLFIGLSILLLIVLRLAWRLSHPVPAAVGLHRWQRVASECVHWLLYASVFGTTMTGWFFASFRGWPISMFASMPLPALTTPGSPIARLIGSWHSAAGWALLFAIAVHVLAAMFHAIVLRDDVLRRMLPVAYFDRDPPR
ncbi:MAG: cytochrome b [Rhodopseudomonas palustris]|uniref:Cytochrome b n=1 Tax=Rhodopseudomonas palustris TaxID=1076 RepID=A0A933VW00_RHOPL|nr:cytochrome b [Rhodopseudomonas palustris]